MTMAMPPTAVGGMPGMPGQPAAEEKPGDNPDSEWFKLSCGVTGRSFYVNEKSNELSTTPVADGYKAEQVRLQSNLSPRRISLDCQQRERRCAVL